MVESVAASTASPVDLSALVALGVISTAVVGAVELEISRNWREPGALYLCGIAAPGEGKTPIIAKLGFPLRNVEQARQEDARPEITDDRTRRELLEAQKKRAVNSGDTVEALEAATQLSELGDPKTLPRLIAQDATPESLVRLLHQNRGRLGVVSDEGGEVFELIRRYSSNGGPNLGIYLKGLDGEPYVEDRVTREPRIIERATLTMALLVQPVVVHELLAKAQEVGRGLAARYLMSWPESSVGRRPTDRPPVDEEVESDWSRLVERLAAEAFARGEPARISLSVDAAREHKTWRADLESKLEPGVGELSGVVEWAAKLPGQVARIALILHVAEQKGLAGEVSGSTMAAAVRLATYFCSHALHIYGAAKADERTKDAVLVLERLRGEGLGTTSLRDLTRKLHWEADRVREAVGILGDHDWVRLDRRQPQDGAGVHRGRPTELLHVHPSLIRNLPKPVTKVTKTSAEGVSVLSVTDFSGVRPAMKAVEAGSRGEDATDRVFDDSDFVEDVDQSVGSEQGLWGA